MCGLFCWLRPLQLFLLPGMQYSLHRLDKYLCPHAATCTPCPAHCHQCSSAATCTVCINGYGLDPTRGKCLSNPRLHPMWDRLPSVPGQRSYLHHVRLQLCPPRQRYRIDYSGSCTPCGDALSGCQICEQAGNAVTCLGCHSAYIEDNTCAQQAAQCTNSFSANSCGAC